MTATNSGATDNPIPLLTTEDNNFLIAADGAPGATTLTASTGDLRGQSATTQDAVAGVYDNTAGAQSSITCAATNCNNGIWVEVDFELRLTFAPPCHKTLVMMAVGC